MRDPKYVDSLANDLALRLRVEDQQGHHTSSDTSVPMPAAMPSHHPSATVLSDFKRLPPSASLLLFTPVIMPSGYVANGEVDIKPVELSSSRKTRTTTDPFEMLGRALGKFHRRIRHVPYVPSVGFTETHDQFLRAADAIIVLTCVPEEPTGAGSSSPCSTSSVSISNQARFVDHAADALEDVERTVPMLNLHFGDTDDEQWSAGAANYKLIWIGDEYNNNTMRSAIELLFGPGK